MTSHFQDDGHDVRPALASVYMQQRPAGCPLARRTRVMSFACYALQFVYILTCFNHGVEYEYDC